MRRTKEEAQGTREKILNAAADIFCEKQYSSVSILEIAGAAGVTKGAVYWHFRNKEELFIMLMRELHDTVKKQFNEISDGIKTLDDLREYHKIMYRSISKKRDLFEKLQKLVFKMHEWPEEVHAALKDLKKIRLEEEIFLNKQILQNEINAERIDKHTNVDEVAEIMAAVTNGVGNLKFLGMMKVDFLNCIDFIFDSLEAKLKKINKGDRQNANERK